MKFYNIVIPPRIIQLFFYTFYFPFIVFFVKKKKSLCTLLKLIPGYLIFSILIMSWFSFICVSSWYCCC